MERIFIGIGTNLGNRQANLKRAVELLAQRGVKVLRASSVIETTPWGVEGQPMFLNMAMECGTALGPEELFHVLKQIEQDMGRTNSPRWGPRVMDLDILFYGDVVINTPTLIIPHPRLHERPFVLEPLSEIAPEFMHPVLGKNIAALKSNL